MNYEDIVEANESFDWDQLGPTNEIPEGFGERSLPDFDSYLDGLIMS